MPKIQARPLLIMCAASAFMAPVAHAESPDSRDVVRDERGGTVVNSFGNCVRTKWVAANDACGAAQVAQAAPVQRREITREERTVYFDFNKASLRPDAKTRLDTLANTLKADAQVRQARVVGYADRIGNTAYNDKLSQRRAQSVRNYLVSRGITTSNVTETRWFGEKNPSSNCSDRLRRAELIACLQPDRRVEVEIDYLPTAARPAGER